MKKLGLIGPTGKMGTLIQKLLIDEYLLVAILHASLKRGDPQSSHDRLLECDVVIDVSLPEGALSFARVVLAQTKTAPAVVIGSTGWTLEGRKELDLLAAKTPVLMASNFSHGAMALTHILRSAAPLLDKLALNPVIIEKHHAKKRDQPSGTALSLQRAVAPAGPGNVQTLSVRAGEVVGDHEVTFYGAHEHVSFSHHARDRSLFAKGAIDVALWLAQQPRDKFKTLISVETYFKEKFL